jgi:hypothetical protein
MKTERMKWVDLVLGLTVAALTVGCEAAPLAAPEFASTMMASVETAGGQPIGGTFEALSVGVPGGVLITPSGQCHFRDWPVTTRFTGNVTGVVTFSENNNTPCAGGHLIGSGPFDGSVTYNGVSGGISGQWTTNCKPDEAQPAGVSCDGTMNARGSGDLEGVHFHFKWGPGWFPFPYSGTASAQ